MGDYHDDCTLSLSRLFAAYFFKAAMPSKCSHGRVQVPLQKCLSTRLLLCHVSHAGLGGAYAINWYNYYFLNFPVIIIILTIYIADRAVIQFSDEGTVRTLRVAEGVPTTFDCSVIVDTLTRFSPGSFVSRSSVTIDWTFIEYDNNLMPQASTTVTDDDT